MRKQDNNYILLEQNRASGFTLVEIVVVVAIMVLMASLIVANYQDSQKNYSVVTAAQRLTADLRRAQNMALSGKTQGALAPGVYGVSVSSANQYKIFYNTISGDVAIDTITLESITLSPIGATIYFYAPSSVPSNSQAFTIVSGSYSKTVTVDAGGSISIN